MSSSVFELHGGGKNTRSELTVATLTTETTNIRVTYIYNDMPYSDMSSKPTFHKRSSWDRLKKIITDNTGKLTKSITDDVSGVGRRSKRNSYEFDSDHSRPTSDAGLLRPNNSSQVRKSSNPTLFVRRSPRMMANKYSLENLLQIAILESNDTAMTKLLTNSSIDVNYIHESGSAAIHQACVHGNLNIIKTLVAYGADIETRTTSGLSALHIANLFGHFDAARYLIEQGASSKDVQDGFVADEKLICSMLSRSCP